jgi:hypothetical protein
MVDSSSSAPLVADYSEWQARDYYQTYYSEVVLPDEKVVLDYQLQVMQRSGQRFGRALEYGCGPTLHRAIAAAPYAFRIDMSDWLAGNLSAVRDWLAADADNDDWTRFTRFILASEKRRRIDTARIRQREQQTRKVVRGLYVSDARWRHPLGRERDAFYDLLVSGFCLDAISADKRVWRRCMRNVLSMVAPGGTVILHFLHRCRAYKVGNRLFPGANLSVDDVARALGEAGFTSDTVDVQVIPCPDNAEYGYAGILTASAVRGPDKTSD